MNGKKSDRPLILLLLSTLTLTLLLTSHIPAARASELVILYSNDIRGETEPCG